MVRGIGTAGAALHQELVRQDPEPLFGLFVDSDTDVLAAGKRAGVVHEQLRFVGAK